MEKNSALFPQYDRANPSWIRGEIPAPITPLRKVRSKCSTLGCHEESLGSGKCAKHEVKNSKNRGYWHRFYGLPIWESLQKAQLAKEPLCQKCATIGRVTVADTVDHAMPHKGSWSLFTDPKNLRSVCASCHSVKTHFERQCAKDGLDPRSFYERSAYD